MSTKINHVDVKGRNKDSSCFLFNTLFASFLPSFIFSPTVLLAVKMAGDLF